MEACPQRSCPWNQSTPESSRSLNSPPKITSSLWKQLSEERNLSGIKLPSFTDSFIDDSVPSGEHGAETSFSPFTKPQDVWKVPSPDPEGDVGQLGARNPWDPLSSNRHRSCTFTSYLGSSSPNSARHSVSIEEDLYGKSDKEPFFPIHSKAVGHDRNTYNTFLDKRDSISLSKEFIPLQQHSLSSNVWDTNPKLPFESSCQGTISGNDSHGFIGNSQSWEPVSSSFRPALRDIGNLSYSSLPSAHQKINNLNYIQTPSDFSSHLSSVPFSTPTHDSYCNQEPTYNYQSQKQHTDLVALMQELSLLTDARDMGNLSYNSTHPCQKPPPSHQSSLSSKGCVFCKNNNYHSTFYKSHVLKDERGHCQCPVLRMYVCPLCNATGDSAHTLKYCPRNTVTRGDPISAGLPPGKVTNWREVANRMMSRYSSNN